VIGLESEMIMSETVVGFAAGWYASTKLVSDIRENSFFDRHLAQLAHLLKRIII
jgi:hypothetical protein